MSTAVPARSFAATLTPAGRGAVAVIGIHGPLADTVLARHFQRPDRGLTSFDPGHPDNTPLRRILYGTWQSSAEHTGPREDIVLTRLETHWELGCHGGAIAAASILRDLNAAGLETTSWQEWLAITSKNRLQASAAVALAAAQSSPAALALLRAAPLTEQTLRDLLALHDSEMRAKQLAKLEALIQTARWAKRLTSPWHIVLAGLPNAGKSSLLNALVGYERAIVFEQPGTTRDVVTAAAAYEGWRWELRDTAGLRATDDSLEAQGIERTTAMLAASDITVLVIDGTRPWQESAELRRAYPHAIMVRNKCDLWESKVPVEAQAELITLSPALSPTTQNDMAENLAGERADAVPISLSAVTGHGLEELRAAIHARLALPAWDSIQACVWDAALEHDLRTLQRALRDDPAALPAVLMELRTWIE
jgi:tRNA modification GTPase